MKTKAKDILATKSLGVISVQPTQSIHEAISKLMDYKIGSVVVIDEDQQLVGIFTERDILRECVRRSDHLKTTTVGSVMTTDLIIGVPNDDVEYLLGIMSKNKIRHIPILDGDIVQGVISIGDLVKAFLSDVSYENRYLKDYIMGKYPG